MQQHFCIPLNEEKGYGLCREGEKSRVRLHAQ
jgi:hypothetical protein